MTQRMNPNSTQVSLRHRPLPLPTHHPHLYLDRSTRRRFRVIAVQYQYELLELYRVASDMRLSHEIMLEYVQPIFEGKVKVLR